MGEEALRSLRACGRAIPANVQRLFPPPPLPTAQRSPTLALLVCVYLSLPESQQVIVKARLTLCAEDDRDFAAALAMLNRRES